MKYFQSKIVKHRSGFYNHFTDIKDYSTTTDDHQYFLKSSTFNGKDSDNIDEFHSHKYE